MNSASAHRNLGQLIVPWALLTSAAIGLTMLPQAALGQQYNVIYLDPNAVEAQWTEERLRKAQPMPRLRPVYDDSLRPSHRSYLSPRQDRADPITLSHEVLPLFDLGDALETYLYDVDDASEEHDGRLARQSPWRPSSTHSKAATKREAPFTTSRVFPAAAFAEMPLIRIGKLYFYFAHNTIDKDRNGACTAAVVERRLVLTAAH